MFQSNKKNALLIGTSNKSEFALGYSTLYGDMCSALSPLGDLYKTEVYELAQYINTITPNLIPSSILEKEPSAELIPNQKDNDSLPPYSLLDPFLMDYIENQNDAAIYNKNPKITQSLIKTIKQNEFKRNQASPITKLSSLSFGKGRRHPINKEI